MKPVLYPKGRANRPGEPRQSRLGSRFDMLKAPSLSRRDASPYPQAGAGRRAGFTLIEMIGVLAIMAILASVMVPNVLHSIEIASVKAENQNLANLADQTKLFHSNRGYLPGSTPIPAGPPQPWNVDLTAYSDLAAADILTNSRQGTRLYVVDPNAPSQRVLILSSMRTSLPLPTAAQVTANFSGIWNTLNNQLPPGFPAAWSTPATQTTLNLTYLAIQRVTLSNLESTSIKSEIQIMQDLGYSVKSYLRSVGVLPTIAIPPAVVNWTTQLAPYTDYSPQDVLSTKRGMTRTYVVEPVAAPAVPTRAMLLSSMLNGVAVPSSANINSISVFDDIWTTPDGTIPSGVSTVLWGAWNANNVQYLTVQRINLHTINITDLQTMTITLSKVFAGGTISYRLVSGTTGATISQNTLPTPAPASLTVMIANVHPHDQLRLYTDALYTTLTYTYIFSADTNNTLTFNFVDSNPSGSPYWRPQ